MLSVYKNIGSNDVVIEQLQVTGSPFHAELGATSYFTFSGSNLDGGRIIEIISGTTPDAGDILSICLVSGCTFDDNEPRISLKYEINSVTANSITAMTINRALPHIGTARMSDIYTGASTTKTSGLLTHNTIDGLFETSERRYSKRCLSTIGTKKTIISAVTDDKQISIATFSAETNYEQIAHQCSTITIPNVMWHENTSMGMTLSDSGSSLYKSESDESYYGKLKVNGTGSSVGKIFYDRKLLVIDDQELAAVMCYESNRNFTLPKPQVSLVAPKDSNYGFTSPNTSYYVTYKLTDGSGNTSYFCTPSIMHCRYIQRLDDKEGNKDISVVVPDFNFKTSDVGGNTGFTYESISVIVATGATDEKRCDATSWKKIVDAVAPTVVVTFP